MKNVFVFLMMMLLSLPTFANRPHPRGGHGHWGGVYRPIPGGHWGGYHPMPRYPRPMPMPGPRYSCQVLMVDGYNRVINRYYGMSRNPWQCSDGLNRCYRDLRWMGGFGSRCVQVR